LHRSLQGWSIVGNIVKLDVIVLARLEHCWKMLVNEKKIFFLMKKIVSSIFLKNDYGEK